MPENGRQAEFAQQPVRGLVDSQNVIDAFSSNGVAGASSTFMVTST
jgi:hypothetical protein